MEKVELILSRAYRIDIPGLIRAISMQAFSLRTMVLELSSHDCPKSQIIPQPMILSTLKHLQKLVIGCVFLFGFDNSIISNPQNAKNHLLKALPACIEDFSLTQCASQEEMDAALIALPALMHSKETSFQMLKKVGWKCAREGVGRLALESYDPDMQKIAIPKRIEFVTEITGKMPQQFCINAPHRVSGPPLWRPYHS